MSEVGLIASLDDRVRGLAIRLLALARVIEPTRLVSARRTLGEQQDCVRRGTSRTMKSLHLRGLAFDVCPERLLTQKNWAPRDAAWPRLGTIGEGLGLTWGGRWKRPDLPHFEYKGKA